MTPSSAKGLDDRGIGWVLDVKHATSAYPEQVKPEKPDYQGRGQPPKARYRDDLCSLSDLALGVGSDAAEAITWREGTPGEVTSRFLTLRVRAANIELRRAAAKHDRELELCWLICEWPDGEDQPVKYWLSNLPADTPIKELVRVGKLRWRIEHDYRELKDALGRDHFEGPATAAFTTTSPSSRWRTRS